MCSMFVGARGSYADYCPPPRWCGCGDCGFRAGRKPAAPPRTLPAWRLIAKFAAAAGAGAEDGGYPRVSTSPPRCRAWELSQDMFNDTVKPVDAPHSKSVFALK